jgi:hypothetical protein
VAAIDACSSSPRCSNKTVSLRSITPIFSSWGI